MRNTDRNIATAALFAMVLLVFAQVVMRVVFLAPLVGAEELVRYLLIGVVFIGMPYATRSGGQIRMEEMQSMFPKWIRLSIRFLAFTGGVVVFGTVAAASIITTLHNLRNTTATLSIPFWIFFLPTILGFVLATFEYAVLWIGFWKHPEIRYADDGMPEHSS